MKLDAILFDLDGTLLPMDQDTFLKAYFGLLARTMAPLGYEPEGMMKAVYTGTMAMLKNDGSMTNRERFWQTFCSLVGEQARNDEPHFDAFYRNEFQQVQASCGYDERAGALIRRLREKGHRLVLATNPLFPVVATQSRIRWAGLDEQDFAWVTTYENASFCKPSVQYYEEIMAKLGLNPENCLMVGNDVGEDMIAGKLGMKTFLLTDCLINRVGEDIAAYPHGSFEALESYIESLENE